jgi:hypothetical protein
MHAAVTTALCFLWALSFIGASVLFGYNCSYWNKGNPQNLNTSAQINKKNLAVLGFLLMIFSGLLFILTLSAGNQGGHLKPFSNVSKA